MNQSFNMGPPTTTDVCDVKSKNVTTHSTIVGPKLVYYTEQQKALELLVIVEEKCPIVQRDGYDTVWWLAIKAWRVRKHITSLSTIE